MLFLQVRQFVRDHEIHFALRHLAQQIIGERDRVSGSRECVGHSAFAGWNQVNLLQFYAEVPRDRERNVAQITGSQCLRPHSQ